MKVLVIDNYDSFTYNLVQYLGELGAEPVAVRNDAAEVDELLSQGFDRVVVSPGPCTPAEAGISLEVVRRFPVHLIEIRPDEFTYGYALTVHKAQGSQWNDVVLFDESFAFREHRARWLYTGLTRAAERVTVVV